MEFSEFKNYNLSEEPSFGKWIKVLSMCDLRMFVCQVSISQIIAPLVMPIWLESPLWVRVHWVIFTMFSRRVEVIRNTPQFFTKHPFKSILEIIRGFECALFCKALHEKDLMEVILEIFRPKLLEILNFE